MLLEKSLPYNIEMIFIESICTDPVVLENNYRLKLGSPDYVGVDPVKARSDFMKRVEEYEKIYETISEEDEKDLSYIKLFNVGEHLDLNKMHGYLAMEIVTYLSNIHINPKRIFLLRHGESENDVKHILSADCNLTKRGKVFASQVRDFLSENQDPSKKMIIFSSTMKSAKCTVNRLRSLHNCEVFFNNIQYVETRLLDELGGGSCEGHTYEEIQLKFPQEYNERQKEKLLYRYPGTGGESYLDVIERVKPMILELESSKEDIVIVSHKVYIIL